MSKQEHWNTVYTTKTPQQVGWTQLYPEDSMKRIEATGLPKSASIIDIGGGDSDLAKILLELGYTDITVLDISAAAIERAKKKIGDRANEIQWIVSDVIDFKPERSYEIWHDRAAFHFLIQEQDINSYLKLIDQFASKYVIIGTFSDIGPTKCSGLPITQYDEPKMSAALEQSNFKIIESDRPVHITPSGGEQPYLFVTASKNLL
jgi:ribosomal protein L11 methylase PrmA